MGDSMQGVDNNILTELIKTVLKTSYRAKERDAKVHSQNEAFMFSVINLFEKDYKISIVNNSNGELCGHYPTKIIVQEYMRPSNSDTSSHSVESLYDIDKLTELFTRSRVARCRTRFVVPVILYEGKHICRGATIASGAEMIGRLGVGMFFSTADAFWSDTADVPASASDMPTDTDSMPASQKEMFDRMRGNDIALLKYLKVQYIIDLMVEKKKVKFGLSVTSSEKVDKENRYSDFTILSLPYPGCEFFRLWRNKGYIGDGLVFDWSQACVNQELDIPKNLSPPRSIKWTSYKEWDIVQLTQNYLKLLLAYLKKGKSSLLVHCISGWDRTPLFVSLLRLSLWADMLAHPSLGPADILYLTIAYDWYLFGHNFYDRISKGEEIFFFCFDFLKHITDDSFSSVHKSRSHRPIRVRSRTEGDDGMAGLLLDPCVYSSSSSINSDSSASTDTQWYIDPAEDDQPSTSGATCRDYQSTTPVAVPGRRVAEIRNNSLSSSWQVISGTGSFKDSSPSSNSPIASANNSSSQKSDTSGDRVHSASASRRKHDYTREDSPRKQRLEAVRRIFMSLYTVHGNIALPSSADNAGSSLYSIMENFAERLGLRTNNFT